MSDSELSEAEDPLTDPARLAELATSAEEHVRRRALLNPVFPNEMREASGLVFLFTIWVNYCFGDTMTFDFSEHEIARDLVAVERFPTDVDDDLAAYEILRRVLGDPGDFDDCGNLEGGPVLTWAGIGAPDWWTADWDWGQVGNPHVEEALNRNIDALFDEGRTIEDEDENVEGMAASVAFSGRESSQQAWASIAEDIRSAVADWPKWLQELADRWHAPGNSDERPELVVRFIEGALARNPASPPEVVQQMATADDAGLRWLVTRNPGASDEVKAMAALSLSSDERFEQHVPDGDLKIRIQSFSLSVIARIWPVDECPFTDELPYDSRTGSDDEVDDAAFELNTGNGSSSVVYEFEGEIVDPDEDE